jgi:hypothetical protein
VKPAAPAGASTVNLLEQDGTFRTELSDDLGRTLTLASAPSDAACDDVDALVSVGRDRHLMVFDFAPIEVDVGRPHIVDQSLEPTVCHSAYALKADPVMFGKPMLHEPAVRWGGPQSIRGHIRESSGDDPNLERLIEKLPER